MLGTVLSWLTKGPLNRALDSLDRSIDNETERQKARGEVAMEFARQQAAVLNGPGRWIMGAMMLLFVIPLGVWFAAVCVYSLLWCRACAYPQAWSIAALPPPLDQWSWAIISSLFVAGAWMTRK